MPFYIRVPSLITPVHCITQTEEPYHFSKVMTDLVDYSKAQFRSRTGIALLDVSHDY
jgi:hypothetical protein